MEKGIQDEVLQKIALSSLKACNVYKCEINIRNLMFAFLIHKGGGTV